LHKAISHEHLRSVILSLRLKLIDVKRLRRRD